MIFLWDKVLRKELQQIHNVLRRQGSYIRHIMGDKQQHMDGKIIQLDKCSLILFICLLNNCWNLVISTSVVDNDSSRNSTIEERVSLLELQVADLEENVVDLDEDVDFLFDEQVIQDERLFSLEQTIFVIDDDVEGKII